MISRTNLFRNWWILDLDFARGKSFEKCGCYANNISTFYRIFRKPSFSVTDIFFLTKHFWHPLLDPSEMLFWRKIQFWTSFEQKWKLEFLDQHFHVFWKSLPFQLQILLILKKKEAGNFHGVPQLEKCVSNRWKFRIPEIQGKNQISSEKNF